MIVLHPFNQPTYYFQKSHSFSLVQVKCESMENCDSNLSCLHRGMYAPTICFSYLMYKEQEMDI